jgi:predicted ATPase
MLEAGTVVGGRYRIESLLGHGGMGAVYRATQLALERQVALKVIKTDAAEEPTAADRFRREALAVARLRHPNIVVVHDFDVCDGVGAFIAMELLDGRSLRDEIRHEGRIAPDRALRILREACAGVGAAHAVGIVHRDLKPDNIFLTPDGVKVLDFGIAKLAEPGATLTGAGEFVGTPAYASPEQCQGEECDARSDVYSLGAVLYHMLTGRPPFTAPRALALLLKHVSQTPEPPSTYAPGLPTTLDEAVLRALAKDPAARPATAAALAAELERLVAGEACETVVEHVTTSPDPTPRPTRAADLGKLPCPASRFVGREREIAETVEAARANRIVTLVGPGGIGKTRLAIEAASHLAESFKDGVWFVDLASVAEPSRVASAAASALEVREEGHDSATAALLAHLRELRALVVLDNCEHVVAATVELARALTRGCPDLHLLATSREALGVAGERLVPVPPLAVEEAGGRRADAVRLFADRAGLAAPGFALTAENAPLVAEICRRLDGIPLALELAAARVSVLSPRQLLDRLSDRFRVLKSVSRASTGRQQTLRAAIDWSHELLDEAERAVFRRLAVFAGGCTLEAAEAVCPDPGEPFDDDVLDVLERLVAKSLVAVATDQHSHDPRFRMLETIREYALERLRESGEEAAALDRLVAWCERFSAEMDDDSSEIGLGERLSRREAEHDNFRLALESALDGRADSAAALRLACSLSRFWNLRGHWSEGREWLGRALEACPDGPAALRAEALHQTANIAERQGDVERAAELYDTSLAIRLEIGDRLGVASTLHNLGINATDRGDYGRARALHLESLELFRQLGDTRGIVIATNGLGVAEKGLGDLDGAIAHYGECLDLLRELGNERAVAVVQYNIGGIMAERGDDEAAAKLLEGSLEVARRISERVLEANVLYALGRMARRTGRLAEAARRHADALRIRREIGDRTGVAASVAAIAGCALDADRAREALVLVEAAVGSLDATGARLDSEDMAQIKRDRTTAHEREPAHEGGAMSLDPAADIAARVADDLSAGDS